MSGGAGSRYVEVPAERMFSFLEERGFRRAEDRSRREVVYERRHHRDPRFRVLVYTSVAAGGASRARRLGADAIRVIAVFEDLRTGRSFGAAKTKRVFRTGTVDGVLARTLERMREAYEVVNRRLHRETYPEATRAWAERRQPGLTRPAPVQAADLRDEDGETEDYRLAMGEDGH